MLTIIFGAGASFDGVPNPGVISEDHRLPLANTLFDWRGSFGPMIENLAPVGVVIGEIRNALTESPDSLPLEEFLEDYYQRAERHPFLLRQLVALRIYLRQYIAECDRVTLGLSSRVTNYGILLNRVRQWQEESKKPVTLITFNYDRLLEDALDTVYGRRFGSLGDYVLNPDIMLFKLHGSVNWGRRLRRITSPAHEGIIAQHMIDNAESTQPTDDFDFLTDPDMRGLFANGLLHWPAIAAPTLTKTGFECPVQHCDILKNIIAKTEHLLVIGWRGMESHFYDWFGERLRGDVKCAVYNKTEEQSDLTAIRLSEQTRIPLPRIRAVGGGFGDFIRQPDELRLFLSGT